MGVRSDLQRQGAAGSGELPGYGSRLCVTLVGD
jgi:hypothetical protein